MNTDADVLPQSSAVSALVRRIVFKLNAALCFNGHKALTDRERASFFDLGNASRVLDCIAILPKMAQDEERARRDLLELYNIFNPGEAQEVTLNLRGLSTSDAEGQS